MAAKKKRRRNKNYERSTNYRSKFFSNEKKKKKYHCAYCGRKLKEEDVEVDHLVPVIKAKNNWLVRFSLRLNGIKNINDPKNLVAACQKCNRKKSSKMGLWVIRGAIGRYKMFWFIRNTLLVLLLLAAVYALHIGLNETELIDKLSAIISILKS